MIKLPESDHYNFATVTTIVMIKQISDESDPSEYNAIYTQTLGDITLPTSAHGVWTWRGV